MNKNRKRRSYEILRKVLGVTLSLIMVLTTVFGGIGGSLMEKVGLGVDEAYAEEIGNKNETQKQVCDNVAGDKAPDGYTDVLGNGSVYRGGQAKSGVTEGGKHYIDDDPSVEPYEPTPYLEKTYVPKAATGQKQEEPEAPKDPTKKGYTFDGWDRTVDDEGNITYTAKWIPVEPVIETETKTVTRTIRYWIEKVDGEMAFKDVVQTVTFTRTKTTDADGNVTYSDWDKESDTFDEVNSPNKNGYTVDLTSVPKLEVKPNSDDVVVDVIYKPKTTPPTPPTPVDPTPEKTYWTTYVDPDGTTIYLEKTYKTVGAAEPPAPANPTKDGYTFDGWDRSVDSDGNITYTARWVPVTTPVDPTPSDPVDPTPSDPVDPTPVDPTPGEPTIWVRYIDGDGNEIYMDKTTFDQTVGEPQGPANPTKDGFIFDGWNRTVDSAGNITYIARWKPVSSTTPSQAKPATNVAKTGDQSNAGMWIGILAIAVLVALIAVLVKVRSKNK